MKSISKQSALCLFDLATPFIVYPVAASLTGAGDAVFANEDVFYILSILALFNMAGLFLLRLYDERWKTFGEEEALRIGLSVLLSTFAGMLFLRIVEALLPVRVFAVAAIMLIMALVAYRVAWYALRKPRALDKCQTTQGSR